jgi:hypothetical protein
MERWYSRSLVHPALQPLRAQAHSLDGFAREDKRSNSEATIPAEHSRHRAAMALLLLEQFCNYSLALDDFRYFEEDSVSIRSTSKNPLPAQGRSDFIRP